MLDDAELFRNDSTHALGCWRLGIRLNFIWMSTVAVLQRKPLLVLQRVLLRLVCKTVAIYRAMNGYSAGRRRHRRRWRATTGDQIHHRAYGWQSVGRCSLQPFFAICMIYVQPQNKWPVCSAFKACLIASKGLLQKIHY